VFALRIVGVAAVAATVGALAVTAPASAHADLKSSTPASGATVTSAPTEVVLQFVDSPAGHTTITVTGPNGTDATAGMTRATGAKATVPLRQQLSNGLYTVAYSTVAADGHPMMGAIEFTLAVPSAGDRGAGDRGTVAPAGWSWDERLLLLPVPVLLLVFLILGARSRHRSAAGSSPPDDHRRAAGE
jgi:methionine-rich copper-binding protein CopC